ncbi:MAG: RNA-guided endonuclease InsQ/TnpB family protein [Promethearchaeota archaeon]
MRLAVKCGVVRLTKRKRALLDAEYDNLQRFLQGDTGVKLYSANRQQAARYYKQPKPGKEYPLSLRQDLIDLHKAKTFWFLRIRVYGQRGGLRIPILPHRAFPKDAELSESKLLRKQGKFYVNLVFTFNAPPLRRGKSVLGVDLGERIIAATVLLQNSCITRPRFLGREVRRIRRHHAWLRRRLQERGLTRVVKRLRDREKRRVDAVLHRISKEIVELAELTMAWIAMGDLTGIRRTTTTKGKRLQRIIGTMPYHRLTRMIIYKAMMRGIPVVLVNEAYTSVTCHVCGRRGVRPTQARFRCPECGEYNADLNGAINIARKVERHLGYMPLCGAACEPALDYAVA